MCFCCKVNQLVNQIVNQLVVNQLVNPLVNPLVNQIVNQLVSQLVGLLIDVTYGTAIDNDMIVVSSIASYSRYCHMNMIEKDLLLCQRFFQFHSVPLEVSFDD